MSGIIEQLRFRAKAKGDADLRAGRKAPTYGPESELEWQAADLLEKAVKALEPFVALTFTGSVYEGAADETAVLYCHADGSQVTIGDFHNARATLTKIKGE
jgi:hypothetical protein